MSQTIQVLLGAESRCCYILAYRPYSVKHLPSLTFALQKHKSVFSCITFHQPTLTQKTLERILHSKIDEDKCLSMHMFSLVMCAYYKKYSLVDRTPESTWHYYCTLGAGPSPGMASTILHSVWCFCCSLTEYVHRSVFLFAWQSPDLEVWVHMSKKVEPLHFQVGVGHNHHDSLSGRVQRTGSLRKVWQDKVFG